MYSDFIKLYEWHQSFKTQLLGVGFMFKSLTQSLASFFYTARIH